jgi:hypothetical protein
MFSPSATGRSTVSFKSVCRSRRSLCQVLGKVSVATIDTDGKPLISLMISEKGGFVGGCGSGRISGGGKELASQFFQINVRGLNRQGRLTSDQSFIVQWVQNDQIAASVATSRTDNGYPAKQHFADKACAVLIEWSVCNYGGRRPRFRCPMSNCGRRTAILYFGTKLACRQCCELAYHTQRVPAHYRAIYRAQAVRKKLRGSINLSLPLPNKPKGMHWETYFRLCHEHDGWEGQSWPSWLRKRAEHRLDVLSGPAGSRE